MRSPATLLLSILGLCAYVPSATFVCVVLGFASTLGATALAGVGVVLMFLGGSALLSRAARDGSRQKYFGALLVVPISGGISYRLLLAAFESDKSALTLGAIFAGLSMWLTVRFVVSYFNWRGSSKGGA